MNELESQRLQKTENPVPRSSFLGLSLLRNRTETLVTQAMCLSVQINSSTSRWLLDCRRDCVGLLGCARILLSEYLTHHEHHGNLLNLQNPRGNGCIEQQRLLIFCAPQASSCREKKTDSARRQRKISSLTPSFRFAGIYATIKAAILWHFPLFIKSLGCM